MSKEKIYWTTEVRKIKDLIDHPSNPRTLSSEAEKHLKRSLKKFDYAEIAAINQDNMILAGHQRLHILRSLKVDDFEIEVRVPNRLLDEKEAKEYLIRSNKNTGEWEWELLESNFSLDDLNDWGFSKSDLDFAIDSTEKQSNATDKEKEEKTCPHCGLII